MDSKGTLTNPVDYGELEANLRNILLRDVRKIQKLGRQYKVEIPKIWFKYFKRLCGKVPTKVEIIVGNYILIKPIFED